MNKANADAPSEPAALDDAARPSDSKRRVVLYSLVESGLATEAEFAALEDFGRAAGRIVVRYRERIEDVLSRRRPKLRLLLGRARRGGFDVVCVRSLNHFAITRSAALRMASELEELGVSVLAQSNIRVNPSDALVRWLRADQQLQSARIKNALGANRARGERTGGIPYGSRLAPDGVHVVPDDRGQAAIDEARRLRSGGASFREIARVLNHAGHRSQVGTPLTHTQVRRMLKGTDEI